MSENLRPSRIENLLDQARIVSKRATCLRRHYGAILVRDNIILSQGYNGAARKEEDCLEKGYCMRDNLKIPSGERYELCHSVHAENNAIINAAVAGVSIKDASLYLYGELHRTGKMIDAKPCMMCARTLLNAGIEKVIANTYDGYIKTYTLDDLRELSRI